MAEPVFQPPPQRPGFEDPIARQQTPFNERDFQDWMKIWSTITRTSPNADDPRNFYDYRGAYRAGLVPAWFYEGRQSGIPYQQPDEMRLHWASQFKQEGHPNQIINGIDTKTGLPVGKDQRRPPAR